MDELEILRKKKLEELRKRYMEGEKQEIPDKPLEVNDANFEEIVIKHKNVAIDCWAPWCGPCLMIAPVIEELAKELKGKVVFGKLNVDENQRTAMRFNIMSIPTILLFKDGKLVDRIIGAMPKEFIVEKLKSLNMI
ncbi:MAG: thioredoxin [Thermoplasmata archaeon]|nr:MAG: thioredoxin [Thermoplasmata archaeon]KAA0016791.1 MAG: thioredoxin [Thermoplasmata archaeon]